MVTGVHNKGNVSDNVSFVLYIIPFVSPEPSPGPWLFSGWVPGKRVRVDLREG